MTLLPVLICHIYKWEPLFEIYYFPVFEALQEYLYVNTCYVIQKVTDRFTFGTNFGLVLRWDGMADILSGLGMHADFMGCFAFCVDRFLPAWKRITGKKLSLHL